MIIMSEVDSRPDETRALDHFTATLIKEALRAAMTAALIIAVIAARNDGDISAVN